MSDDNPLLKGDFAHLTRSMTNEEKEAAVKAIKSVQEAMLDVSRTTISGFTPAEPKKATTPLRFIELEDHQTFGGTVYVRMTTEVVRKRLNYKPVDATLPAWKMAQEFKVDASQLKFPGKTQRTNHKGEKVESSFGPYDILLPASALSPSIVRDKMFKLSHRHFTFEPSDEGQQAYIDAQRRADQAAHAALVERRRAETLRAFEGYDDVGEFA